MRTVIIFIFGLLIGAGGFHAWYMLQTAEKRCGLDHPLDDHMRAACVAAGLPGYTKAARRELDDLVRDVGQ